MSAIDDPIEPTSPEGRTAWKKSAVVAVPAVLAVGVLATLMSQGALAASFAVSGTNFKMSSGHLVSAGLSSYVQVDRSGDGAKHAVSLLALKDVRLSDICQSTRIDTPIGTVVFRLTAGGDAGTVTAGSLTIDGDSLSGDSNFGAAQIGRDAGTLDAVPGVKGPAGTFGMQVKDVDVTKVHSSAWSAMGGDFRLKGMSISLRKDGKECY
ncbi:DUF6230 family protein [Streptomyces odontomachi]|uniref:DUF6230 family protein n=1 Tax=Streptomyces odontomachi TaxID=2944940 RepID=UPI002109D97E|nr:DUF6230 family protein [Streptomyces sp. ODS25]